jgi:hypothetical protein
MALFTLGIIAANTIAAEQQRKKASKAKKKIRGVSGSPILDDVQQSIQQGVPQNLLAQFRADAKRNLGRFARSLRVSAGAASDSQRAVSGTALRRQLSGQGAQLDLAESVVRSPGELKRQVGRESFSRLGQISSLRRGLQGFNIRQGLVRDEFEQASRAARGRSIGQTAQLGALGILEEQAKRRRQQNN